RPAVRTAWSTRVRSSDRGRVRRGARTTRGSVCGAVCWHGGAASCARAPCARAACSRFGARGGPGLGPRECRGGGGRQGRRGATGGCCRRGLAPLRAFALAPFQARSAGTEALARGECSLARAARGVEPLATV